MVSWGWHCLAAGCTLGTGTGHQTFPTCFLTAASRSSCTTSCPTQPEAVKPLVQVSSNACKSSRSRGRAAASHHILGSFPALVLEPPPHLIQAHLLAGEGEGEAERQHVCHQVLLRLEVHDAVDDVVKELWVVAVVSVAQAGAMLAGLSQPHRGPVESKEGGNAHALAPAPGQRCSASPPRQCPA